jgi:peptidoglycan/LPS O-acetylase OafA/YrhL
MKYRTDIDGLRAIAVISVIIFHLGFLPNGYLGVDIFFVISGFLITSIIYKEIIEKKFSILKFYERRVRRIIPLLLFVSATAFLTGIFLMLPDDLENLAQAVLASNFSVNNILMYLTSADYWATKNEYKPLMHTWSLGIEEQYYLIYPFLLLVISRIKISYIKILLSIITLVSILLFLFDGTSASRFYLLHFRFFELSIGGLAAILFYKTLEINSKWRYLYYSSLILLLLILISSFGSNQIKVILTTLLTVTILVIGKFFYQKDKFINILLQNKLVVYIGNISFSLYMWHQVIFAFSRYSLFEKIGMLQYFLLIAVVILLSVLTYHFIENPFRDKNVLSTRKVLVIVGTFFIITSVSSFYIYSIGGIYKDFPSLGLYRKDNTKRGYNLFSGADNIHIHYNESAAKLDKKFQSSGEPKILVIGNSYGRDMVNVFKESSISGQIQISFFGIKRIKSDKEIAERMQDADYVFFATDEFVSKAWVKEIGEIHKFNIDFNKIYFFGTKDFGYSNGIHYKKIHEISEFSKYYTQMRDGTIGIDSSIKHEWGSHYISLIDPVKGNNNGVRVFTDDGKFISQDTYHFTRFGAIYYAKSLDEKLKEIIKI